MNKSFVPKKRMHTKFTNELDKEMLQIVSNLGIKQVSKIWTQKILLKMVYLDQKELSGSIKEYCKTFRYASQSVDIIMRARKLFHQLYKSRLCTRFMNRPYGYSIIR